MSKFFKVVLSSFALIAVFFSTFTAAHRADAAVNVPQSPYALTSSAVTIGTSSMISGYTGSVRVIIRSSNTGGLLSITSTSGLTRVSGYDNSSTITTAGDQIAFEALVSDANAALASLRYRGTVVQTDSISITVEAAGYSSRVVTEDCDNDGDAEPCYHYYKAVTGTRTWAQAQQHTVDVAQTIGSQSVYGWLTTITSLEENTFVSQYVNVDSWIGATDAANEGDWAWVSNSEPTVRNRVFWRGLSNGSTQNSLYARWSSGEPNDSSGEDYAQFLSSGFWNDLPGHFTQNAYIWETTSTTNLLGSDEVTFSVPVYSGPANLTVPIVSGNSRLGETLSTTDGTWSDNGQSITASAIKWQRNTGSGWVDIATATGATYVLQNADVGATIRSVVSKTNTAGTSSANSLASATVLPLTPSAPSISSITAGNNQISVSFSAPSSNGGGSITGYHYSLNGGTTWVTNANVTSSPFVISGLTNGTTYSIKVRAVNAGGNGLESSEISVVPFGPPTNSSAPLIEQTPRVGEQLNFSTGIWSANGSSITSISQQWQRNSGSGWTNISGATSSTYLVNLSDVGSQLRVVVTQSNVAGTTVVSSSPTTTVVVTPPDRPQVSNIVWGIGQVTFTAMEGASNGGASVQLEYSLDGNSWTTLLPQNNNRFTINGLVPGQSYLISVRSTNTAGSTVASVNISGNTLNPSVSVSPTISNSPTSPIFTRDPQTAPSSLITAGTVLPAELRNVISAPVSISREALSQLISSSGSLPRIQVDEGGRPDLTPLQSIALLNGEPVAVTLQPTIDNDGYVLVGPDFQIKLSIPSSQNGSDLMLNLSIGKFANLSVSGFAPGQPIYLWLFSDPTEVGFVTADENGNFEGQVRIPDDLDPGDHTLQVNGVTSSGDVRTVAVGVTLSQDELATTTETVQSDWLPMWLLLSFFALAVVLIGVVIFRRRRN